MGRTVKEKLLRAIKKFPLTVKSEVDPSSLLVAQSNSVVDSKPSMNLEENLWDCFTEENLKDILLKHLDLLYNQAICHLLVLGFDEGMVTKAVLSNGHCYGELDVLNNIVNNSLSYLNNCNEGGGVIWNCEDQSESDFTDLRDLEEYSLANMVDSVQQVKPNLSKADAMWCLLMSELDVDKASTIDIPSSCTDPACAETCEQPCEESVSSLLEKFSDLNFDETLESAGKDDQDDEDGVVVTLLHQVKDLENKLKERKDWAQKKAMQAAQRVGDEIAELRSLSNQRESIQMLKKRKQAVKETALEKFSVMNTVLGEANSNIQKAAAIVGTIEKQNAEIRAETVGFKLSASESLKAGLEAAKKEKQCLKKLMALEKQKLKLEEEIEAGKEKIKDLYKDLAQITQDDKDNEAKRIEEQKAKEKALTQVEEEQRSKEAAEATNERNLKTLMLKTEIDFQRHKDDQQRLEEELKLLKDSSNQSKNIGKLLEELEGCYEDEVKNNRKCIICKKDEVSVMFLPCAHQVVCGRCSDSLLSNNNGGSKVICPCCRVLVQQRVRVFGETS